MVCLLIYIPASDSYSILASRIIYNTHQWMGGAYPRGHDIAAKRPDADNHHAAQFQCSHHRSLCIDTFFVLQPFSQR